MASTYLENLIQARDNIAETLSRITKDPKPTYSVDGKSVSWTEYLTALTQQLKALNEAIQVAGGPVQLATRYTT